MSLKQPESLFCHDAANGSTDQFKGVFSYFLTRTNIATIFFVKNDYCIYVRGSCEHYFTGWDKIFTVHPVYRFSILRYWHKYSANFNQYPFHIKYGKICEFLHIKTAESKRSPCYERTLAQFHADWYSELRNFLICSAKKRKSCIIVECPFTIKCVTCLLIQVIKIFVFYWYCSMYLEVPCM